MTKELKHKLKPIDVPLYHGKLVIVISEDEKKVFDATGGSNIWDEKNMNLHAHAIKGNHKGWTGYFIVLNPYNKDRYININHGTISHEVNHVVSFIFDNNGIQWDAHNDEPMAYLTEWITNEVYKVFEELKITIKARR